MVRDCKDWRKCLGLFGGEKMPSGKNALSIILYVYGTSYIERMEKKTLVDMISELGIMEDEAELVVEEWYKEGVL